MMVESEFKFPIKVFTCLSGIRIGGQPKLSVGGDFLCFLFRDRIVPQAPRQMYCTGDTLVLYLLVASLLELSNPGNKI